MNGFLYRKKKFIHFFVWINCEKVWKTFKKSLNHSAFNVENFLHRKCAKQQYIVSTIDNHSYMLYNSDNQANAKMHAKLKGNDKKCALRMLK